MKTSLQNLTQSTIRSSSCRLRGGVGHLDNAGNPEKPAEKAPKGSTAPLDDIPVAQRETPPVAPPSKVNVVVLASSLTVLGIVALAAGGFVSFRLQQAQTNQAIAKPTPEAVQSSSPTAVGTSPTPTATSAPDTLLGHIAYKEAPASELVPIVSDGSIKMRSAAAKAFREMSAAAQRDGVNLVPISAFRSINDQTYLYFDVKAERNQDAKERAKVSAPPGYSEHHTGYAVDVGDGNAPALNLNPEFDKSSAYRWLKANAARYSFELSFPKNNAQGVSYEPWHWRFVGDIQSLKTFYEARSLRRP